MQISLHTASSAATYVRNQEWRAARLPTCPLHPSGGCSFARHGSYPRLTPKGLRIARWYCPEGHRTFSLLPDFLAARLPDLLDSIEETVTVAQSAKSLEVAADLLRGPDVTLPGAIRWLRRRVRAVGSALAAVARLAPDPSVGIDIGQGHVLRRLRRSLPMTILADIPAPLGFEAFRPAGRARDRSQHEAWPDGAIMSRYGWVFKRGGSIMRRQQPPPMPATAVPTAEDMFRIWRADRCVQDASARHYIRWIKWFRFYAARHGLDERAELTLEGARRFGLWYAQHRHIDLKQLDNTARTALHALSRVYRMMGLNPPTWHVPQPPSPPVSSVLQEYVDHLLHHRGSPAVTVERRLDHVGRLLEHLAENGKTWLTMRLTDIDDFLIGCAQRFTHSTVADIAGSVRSFSRFLLATGRISIALADSVISPAQQRFERPRRALPWEDVQRLLRAVDTSTARGLRDYALLLTMSTYGLGAGEAIRLQFQDIDWTADTIRVIRPKTRVAFTLPMLPAVAEALALYLYNGRPRNTPTKHVFIQMMTPFGPLSGSSPVRHIIVKYAKAAGLNAPYLGSHVLRHSNAARQIDLGIRPQVLSDLLGHRDSESISAYVRIATETLRDISLPVPT